jgi:hypothetical protein
MIKILAVFSASLSRLLSFVRRTRFLTFAKRGPPASRLSNANKTLPSARLSHAGAESDVWSVGNTHPLDSLTSQAGSSLLGYKGDVLGSRDWGPGLAVCFPKNATCMQNLTGPR